MTQVWFNPKLVPKVKVLNMSTYLVSGSLGKSIPNIFKLLPKAILWLYNLSTNSHNFWCFGFIYKIHLCIPEAPLNTKKFNYWWKNPKNVSSRNYTIFRIQQNWFHNFCNFLHFLVHFTSCQLKEKDKTQHDSAETDRSTHEHRGKLPRAGHPRPRCAFLRKDPC
jgi:hypothetical protein